MVVSVIPSFVVRTTISTTSWGLLPVTAAARFLFPILSILVPIIQFLRHSRLGRSSLGMSVFVYWHNTRLLLDQGRSTNPFAKLHISVFIIAELVTRYDVVMLVLPPPFQHALVVPATCEQCEGATNNVGEDVKGVKVAAVGEERLDDLGPDCEAGRAY